MRLLNQIPTEQERAFLRSTMTDIARALALAGLKKMPIKVLAMCRSHIPNHGVGYEFRLFDLTPIDSSVVQGSAENGAMYLMRKLLETQGVLMCGFMAGQHGHQGPELVMKLATRRDMQRIELKVHTSDGACTLTPARG